MTNYNITPVQLGERINEIDIIRGLALFGILIENMIYFKYPIFFDRFPSTISPGFDQVGAWLIQLLFIGKFYMIFSFLFGLGFYIFMERIRERGLELVPFYRRRLLALLLFGLLHLVLLWTGDILFIYALVGFIMLGFKNKTAGAIKKWIISLFVVSLILYVLFGLYNGLNQQIAGEKYAFYVAGFTDYTLSAYAESSFIQLVFFRALNELPQAFISLIVTIPSVLALFLCGIYVGKKGVFNDLAGNVSLFRKIRNLGLSFGALLLIIYVLAETGLWPVGVLVRPAILLASNYAASIFIFPAYVAIFLLALQTGFWRKILAPIAAAGRMALTNYLSQTIICVFIFNGFGLGLLNRASVIQGIMITLAIYLVQIVWSNLWLSKFNYGPMEWLWRGLTYKKRQPFMIGK